MKHNMLQKTEGTWENVVRRVAQSWTWLTSLVSLIGNRILGRCLHKSDMTQTVFWDN